LTPRLLTQSGDSTDNRVNECNRDVTPTADWSLVGAACYDSIVFNLGNPKTGGDWIVHIAGAIVAIFLVWWMLRLYVL
jgi:hypothetical protein